MALRVLCILNISTRWTSGRLYRRVKQVPAPIEKKYGRTKYLIIQASDHMPKRIQMISIFLSLCVYNKNRIRNYM